METQCYICQKCFDDHSTDLNCGQYAFIKATNKALDLAFAKIWDNLKQETTIEE